MTKLEKEIAEAIFTGLERYSDDIINVAALAAAEVAQRYIEASFDAGAYAYGPTFMGCKTQWLKENGIIE